MKHSFGILFVVVLLFFVSQVVGLLITDAYREESKEGFVWKDLPTFAGVRLERPDVSPQLVSVFFLAGIALGTVLVWFLMRFRSLWLWRVWFFLTVWLCLFVAFGSFLTELFAFLAGLVFAWLKVFRPSLIMHNFTELFVYGGLAAIFVPMLTIASVSVLLILIALYDAYAVWKSKHMIALAKFQMKSKVFAGLLIPYKLPKKVKKAAVSKKVQTALLGGGDIAFPLLFAGTVMTLFGFWQSLIVSVCASFALFLLMYLGQRDRFYPAMPFISAGCFVGYGIIVLLNSL